MEALSIVIAWRRPGKPLPCPGDRRRPPSRRRRGRTPRGMERARQARRGAGAVPLVGGRGRLRLLRPDRPRRAGPRGLPGRRHPVRDRHRHPPRALLLLARARLRGGRLLPRLPHRPRTRGRARADGRLRALRRAPVAPRHARGDPGGGGLLRPARPGGGRPPGRAARGMAAQPRDHRGRRADEPDRLPARALRLPALEDRLRGRGPRDVDRALRDHRRRVDERGRGGAPARGRRGGAGRGGLRGARPMSHPALADGARFRRRGRLLVAAAAIFWSLGGLMARSVGTDPWTTVFWRGLFCAAFLVAVTAVREGRRTPGVFAGMGGAGIGMAMCFAIGSTCFILALHHTSVANVLIIQSLSPFIAGLLGWIWVGERVAGRTWLAMGVALLGTAVMVSRYFYSTPARGSLGGDLLAFAVAFTFALATVLLRRRRQVQMLPAAALAAALTSAIASVAATPGAAGAGDLTLLALFGAGQLGLGMIMFTTGARRIPVAEASLIAVLESVLGPVWVWLALGENPGLPSLGGGAVVLAALAGHTLADLRLERGAPADAQVGSRNRSSTGT